MADLNLNGHKNLGDFFPSAHVSMGRVTSFLVGAVATGGIVKVSVS